MTPVKDDTQEIDFCRVPNHWVTDGNQAMMNALLLKFPASQRQRCIKHKKDMGGAQLGYVSTAQQQGVKPEVKAILYQNSRENADQQVTAFIEKHSTSYPTAVECWKRDLEACLTFYAFPPAYWKTMRTTNVVERPLRRSEERQPQDGHRFW